MSKCKFNSMEEAHHVPVTGIKTDLYRWPNKQPNDMIPPFQVLFSKPKPTLSKFDFLIEKSKPSIDDIVLEGYFWVGCDEAFPEKPKTSDS